MKQQITILTFLVFTILNVMGQTEEVKVYDPSADAKKDVSSALKKAGEENKNVLVMVGGNWCPWCIRLNKYILDDPEIDSLIKADFIWIKVNYSKENKNTDLLKKWGGPQRFGFPVFVVLDNKGNRIHIQDTGLLEKDKSYDRKKLIGFLRNWNVDAIDPDNY